MRFALPILSSFRFVWANPVQLILPPQPVSKGVPKRGHPLILDCESPTDAELLGFALPILSSFRFVWANPVQCIKQIGKNRDFRTSLLFINYSKGWTYLRREAYETRRVRKRALLSNSRPSLRKGQRYWMARVVYLRCSAPQIRRVRDRTSAIRKQNEPGKSGFVLFPYGGMQESKHKPAD